MCTSAAQLCHKLTSSHALLQPVRTASGVPPASPSCTKTQLPLTSCCAAAAVVCISAGQVADKLPNAPAVLVTAGDEGAAYCCRSTKGEHTGFVPVFKVDVADTTGAGDAFTAGFVYKVGTG